MRKVKIIFFENDSIDSIFEISNLQPKTRIRYIFKFIINFLKGD